MIGPPGSGKTMLARRLPSLLSLSLSEEEALEVTRIHSVAGLLEPGNPLVRERPYRAPHHSISHVGLVGGGAPAPPARRDHPLPIAASSSWTSCPSSAATPWRCCASPWRKVASPSAVP